MEIAQRFNHTRNEFFRRRAELTVLQKVTIALAMAVLTGILAQVKVYLPFTPIPITLQTFAVLLSGVVLGRWWGGASMAVYAIGGIVGIPWFAGAASGFGATFGYLVGFVLASLAVGYFVDMYSWARRFGGMLLVMCVVSLALIYIPGVIWLGMWLAFSGNAVSPSTLFGMGLAPFIIGDVVKAIIAAGTGYAVIPKKL